MFIVADTRTDTVYVTDFSSASVTVLDGSRCNAETTAGCRRAGRTQAVGSSPEGMAVNPRTGVVYVGNVYRAGSLSVFAARRP